MPRPIKMRAAYRDAAAYQLRLEAAVAIDVRLPEARRREGMAKIRDVAKWCFESDEFINKSNLSANRHKASK